MLGKGEFGRIRDLLAPLSGSGAFDLKDDAGVISGILGHEIVVTTDTIVAGVHFLGSESPEEVAAKLLRVNLSDLAAMGTKPICYTLNWSLPSSYSDEWVISFCAGLKVQQEMFDIYLLGGDSTSTPGPACLTATLFGHVPRGQLLRRAGAKSGETIFVSGTIGDGALGLLAAQGMLADLDEVLIQKLIGCYRIPEPRIRLGIALRGRASAAADISDGLLADIRHLTEIAGLGAEIKMSEIPLSCGARNAIAKNGELWQVIVGGGDDYELVFTGEPDLADSLLNVGVNITAIGKITAEPGVNLIGADGNIMQVNKEGYCHS